MFPEEAVQASQALEANYFMPIHWGAFTLSTHTWIEPIERALFKSKEVGQKIIAPQVGEIMSLKHLKPDYKDWWVQ